jgi:hypothetical protein
LNVVGLPHRFGFTGYKVKAVRGQIGLRENRAPLRAMERGDLPSAQKKCGFDQSTAVALFVSFFIGLAS